MFRWLRKPYLPLHEPAKSWLTKPANWSGRTIVTAFWEDMPERCFDCDAPIVTEKLDPLNIEGKIQYMRVITKCPNGCGRTEWIA